jgi:hypothetical protein
MKPTGFEPGRLREMFEEVEGVLRWRLDRPLSHFPVGGEKARANWRARFAGKPAGTTEQDGRTRVMIDGRSYDVRTIIAEIGGTTDGVPSEIGGTTDGAGEGPLARVMLAASVETGRTITERS